MKEKKTLSVVLGERISSFRESTGKRQEDIAAAARFWGLEWTRVTVAAIELGRRQLSLEEFLLLPGIFLQAGIRISTKEGRSMVTPQFADLFLSDALIILTASTTVFPDSLRELLDSRARISPIDYPYTRKADVEELRSSSGGARSSHRLRVATLAKQARYHKLGDALTDYLLESKNPKEVTLCLRAFKDQHGDAELKAARKLKTSPFVVTFAALQQWDHSLTVERDTHLAGQVHNATPARTVQALRGHITRELLADLLPHVQELMNTINTRQA